MGWTVVYSSHKAHLIEIVKSILGENSIQFVIVDKTDSMYNSMLEPNAEVHIQDEDFLKGKQLISHIES